MHCAWPGDYHSLSLTRIQFHPPKVTPLTNLQEVTVQGPIKGCAEINLYDPSLLPTLQCTLQCMWHAQKCITGTQTFPISKLGGWKHSTALHKSSEASRHQALKHLRQYWYYGNRSVVGNRGGRWILWNRGDIGLSSANREITLH